MSEDFDDSDDLSSFFFLSEDSSSEESSLDDEESDEESLELESDAGKGVLTAVFRAFLSAFLAGLFSEDEESEESESGSESEESEESESESEESDEEGSLLFSDDSLSELPDSDEEESEDSEDEESFLVDSILAFLALGASFSDSEELESDSEELDSALRFTPVDLRPAAGALSSSSASLSELEEEDEEDEEDEEEEEEEEEEDDEREDFLDCASPISTSESLDSSELLSLPLSLEELELELELELEDSSDFLVQFWKTSSKDGAFFELVWEIDLSACSLAKTLLVLSKPFSDKNVAIEATNCGGGEFY